MISSSSNASGLFSLFLSSSIHSFVHLIETGALWSLSFFTLFSFFYFLRFALFYLTLMSFKKSLQPSIRTWTLSCNSFDVIARHFLVGFMLHSFTRNLFRNFFSTIAVEILSLFQLHFKAHDTGSEWVLSGQYCPLFLSSKTSLSCLNLLVMILKWLSC